MKSIIVKPIITEKSISETKENKYSFEINNSANKIEVANAVKEFYKVDAIKVNIVNVEGKIKKFKGRLGGRTKKIKKAIVTLKKGQKIEGFEIK